MHKKDIHSYNVNIPWTKVKSNMTMQKTDYTNIY